MQIGRQTLGHGVIARVARYFKAMKFIVHFFLEKPDPRETQGQMLGAHSAEFPDLKVAIEETKEEADALGAGVFELESDNDSIRQRWERDDGGWKRSSNTHRN